MHQDLATMLGRPLSRLELKVLGFCMQELLDHEYAGGGKMPTPDEP